MTDFSRHLSEQFAPDLQRLHEVMRGNLGAEVALLTQMKERDYFAGGKQLRAIVAMLSARLCGAPQKDGELVAAAIEFIHTSTLLHDDVVDEAPLRRHLPAAAKVYGNAIAVLAGDFLYSRASQMLVQTGNLALLSRMAQVTNQLAQGELLQLQSRGQPDLDAGTYHTIIRCKTANLFSAAAAVGALLAGEDDSALSDYGLHLGAAFQLVDDCLDYEGEGAELGKKIGADFSEGKMTLPVIVMLSRIGEEQRAALMREWRAGADSFSQIAALLRDTGALAAVRQLAAENTGKAAAALSSYPDSAEKAALVGLAEASARRTK